MASRNTTARLNDHFASFAEAKVNEGRFGSTDDVVLAGLELLEEREAKRAALIQALIDGENSGPSTPFDFDEFLAEKRRNYKAG